MLEKWFKDFVCTEEEVDGYECVRQALMLSRELSRLKEVRNAHRELIQLDNTLSSHVKEMEDFGLEAGRTGDAAAQRETLLAALRRGPPHGRGERSVPWRAERGPGLGPAAVRERG